MEQGRDHQAMGSAAVPYSAIHHANGLQSDCMVLMPALAVRLLDSHVYALWPWATNCHPVTMT